MLELLGKLSVKLQPLRKLSYFFIAVLVTWLTFYFLEPSSVEKQPTNPYAMLSFVSCIWLLLLNVMISIFDNVPRLDKQQTVFKRLKIKVLRFFYHLLAILFVGLTLAIIFLTVRMLRV